MTSRWRAPGPRAARSAGPLYLLTDSHWTPAGVHAGYAATVQALARWYPTLTPLPRDAFAVPDGAVGELAPHDDVIRLGADVARVGDLAAQCDADVPCFEFDDAHVAPAC